MIKQIVRCQVYEWYGSEDFTEGRYKPKGGKAFAFEVTPATEALDEDELIEKFNEVLNVHGRWYRYEARSIEYYWDPTMIKFEDGKFLE